MDSMRIPSELLIAAILTFPLTGCDASSSNEPGIDGGDAAVGDASTDAPDAMDGTDGMDTDVADADPMGDVATDSADIGEDIERDPASDVGGRHGFGGPGRWRCRFRSPGCARLRRRRRSPRIGGGLRCGRLGWATG